VDSGEFDPLNATSFPPATSKQVPIPNWAMLLFAAALAAMQRKFRPKY
jgi:hypothetical protein